MRRLRIIPVLLLDGTSAVKTHQFKPARYIGDIVNAAQIFNSKMADELIVVDIGYHQDNPSRPEVIRHLAEECFMPLAFGGGISSVDEAAALFKDGIEKVSINTAFVEGGALVEEAARQFGSQSVVASIDARREADGSYQVYSRGGTRALGIDPVEMARRAEAQGAGEILIQSIDRDGMRKGYDRNLVRSIVDATTLPVVALGGADTVDDLAQVILRDGASAAAAGSMFAFYGRLQAVLINYPRPEERDAAAARANIGEETMAEA
ncbi:glycosyl amidation-associated protein WbuZ [Erythrobacter litoralis]|uniref:Imidazole glycerol phosphate synthase subunit HisF n=1 Tax=Erythrobacter litoralis (strain HTCC2594) TaxID=314225 RepID=Q2N6D2_ERYLH|nr:glycosyl amidation-associated protein WbuZ [Erythrobacter litoralis]ABC64759.1 imidazoleglycerol-phosphate synthase, cyclase subunit [Erythrobacter litoralis HTCC2594]